MMPESTPGSLHKSEQSGAPDRTAEFRRPGLHGLSGQIQKIAVAEVVPEMPQSRAARTGRDEQAVEIGCLERFRPSDSQAFRFILCRALALPDFDKSLSRRLSHCSHLRPIHQFLKAIGAVFLWPGTEFRHIVMESWPRETSIGTGT